MIRLYKAEAGLPMKDWRAVQEEAKSASAK
jgi:hypothetical protein